MTTQDSTTWACPWESCNHKQAQECRENLHPRKGCGGMFPGMTAEQAKEFIKPRATQAGVKADGATE